MGAKLGLKCVVYQNTGSWGTPVWAAINKIADTTVNPAWDEAEANTRESLIKMTAKTQLALEVTGRIRVDNTDTGYLALRDALYSHNPIDLLILNGPSTENGAHGWRADWHVFGGTENQSLPNVLYMEFTIKPAPTDNLPKKAIVASGSPVFTDVA